jgi:hypothetical protein
VNKRAILLVILIVVVALLTAALPAFGAPPHATPVSGLECIYVDTPGVMEPIGQMLFIRGQVNVNRFYSDDPATFPDGTNTAVLDAVVNLKSGMIVWNAEAVFQPDGMEGTFEGIGQGWFKIDPAGAVDGKGVGVFHGTGELEGLTLKQDLYPGDITQCPGAFDASWWQGFIVPPDP